MHTHVRQVLERWEHFRQHRHLDGTGDMQFTFHTSVLLRRTNEFLRGLGRMYEHQRQNDQTQQHQQEDDPSDMIKFSKQRFLRNDNLDMPSRRPDLGIVDIVFLTGDSVRNRHDVLSLVRPNGRITAGDYLQVFRNRLQVIQ